MRGRIAAIEALAALALCALAPAAAGEEVEAAPKDGAGTATQIELRWWEIDPWTDPERGFHYYPPERMKRRESTRKAPDTQAAKAAKVPKKLEEIASIEELRAETQRRLEAAVMNPTEENMEAYLQANTLMLRKSAMFADMWRRTVWTHPEFDFNVQNPYANFAQVQLRQDRRNRVESAIRSMAGDFGLLFFYRSDCPYCKLQAPVLRMLSDRYGIEVLPVSLDGGPLEGWPEARPDNGISMRVSGGAGVEVVPTLYLVSRDTRQAVMLGSGVLAMDEILERAYALTQLRPGADIGGGLR